MKKHLFQGLLIIVALPLVLLFPKKGDQSDFVNFEIAQIRQQNITEFVVAGPVLEDPAIKQYVSSAKKIGGTQNVAVQFRSPHEAEKAVSQIRSSFGSEFVERDVKMHITATYNDTLFADQFNLPQMEVTTGWDFLTDSSSIKIAIVDTGVRGTHEDLTGKVLAGRNVINSTNISANANSDDYGHGTAMASAAGATANNAKGIAGIAFSSSLVPVKVLDSSGNGLSSDASTGIRWAADSGAKVINLSFGGSGYSQTMHDAIAYARGLDCIVVASAGNDGGALLYPASDSLTLAVGSVNSSNVHSSFSNYGSELDVTSPGEGVPVATFIANNSYGSSTGTSVAAAQVSGLAALGKVWHSSANSDQILGYIRSSAYKLQGMNGNSDAYYGYGLADYARMQSAVGNFSAQYAGQSNYPNVNDGIAQSMTISYRNTGTSTWRRGTVNLGTVNSNYTYRTNSYPLAESWASSDRPARLNEASVAPGEVGTFTFTVKNNSLPAGNYRLDVGLVADGITWFSANTHAYWDVYVNNPYSAQAVGQSNYPTINAGDTQTMTISYRNTGSATWTRGTVNLGTVNSNYSYRTNSYPLAESWASSDRPARLNEATVAPGEVGTFTFTVKNNSLPAGNYRLDVGLVADGITWFSANTHAYWDVYVNNPYSAQAVGQSNYPTINAGDTQTMTISYRNTGSATWTRGTVNLGTVNPNYSYRTNSYPLAESWASSDRPARLNEASVAPGEVGTFTFTIRNNNLSAGNYRLDVGLVADGITWFSANTHAYWDVYVNNPYSAQPIGQSNYPTINAGATQTMTISYRNTGSATWTRGTVNLGTVNPNYTYRTSSYPLAESWASSDRPARLNEASVAPGEVGTFTFTVKNNSLPAGNYRLDVGLVADGITWFSANTHAYWDVMVP